MQSKSPSRQSGGDAADEAAVSIQLSVFSSMAGHEHGCGKMNASCEEER